MSEHIGYTMPEYLRQKREAQLRQWLVQAVGLALLVAGFAVAGTLMPRINAIRRERQLVIDPRHIKGLPPDIALLGKLGTFRALAIDWASIRADRLKEEGKTYEALQLHEIVCQLAPHFPQVWGHAAWNMAYNISVMKYTPEERWQWVRNGIEILRDKGIQYNPLSVGLYKELSWIYWHKIGDFLDDEHLNYKKALAVEMEKVLGAPPVVLNEQEYFDWFKRIVEAPGVEDLIDSDPEVSQLVSRLRAVGLAPDRALLEAVARNLRPELQPRQLRKDEEDPDSPVARQKATLTDPDVAGALDRLLAALRNRELRTEYRLDLAYLHRLMVEEYGPLDLRNAFTHALYWSSYGDHITRGKEGASRADVVNTARFVFFALQKLVTNGKTILWPDFDDPFASYVELLPDLRFIPYLHRAYLRLGKEHFGDDPRFKEGTPGPNYMTGFVTHMRQWIELLYLEGGDANLRQAQEYLNWLRDNVPHPDGTTQEQYQQSLEEFVMGDILDQLSTYKAAGAIIRRFLQRALWELAWGERDAAMRNLERARLAYEYWMTDTRRDINDRRMLQPMALLLRDSIEVFFRDPTIAPLVKARLWRDLWLEQKQQVYDRLRPYFEALAAAQVPSWDVNLAFPEPPGMEAARQRDAEDRGQRREDIEQGERSP